MVDTHPMPATLTAEEAAKYLGITTSQFRAAVARGDFPQPVIRGRPFRWGRAAIDNALAGEGAVDNSSAEDDQRQIAELRERIRNSAK